MTEADERTDGEGEGKDESEDEVELEANGIVVRYRETEAERLLEFDRDERTAAVAQNRDGYAVLAVRSTADGVELERYYGFDAALDHAAELLAVSPRELPVPERAEDMGL